MYWLEIAQKSNDAIKASRGVNSKLYRCCESIE